MMMLGLSDLLFYAFSAGIVIMSIMVVFMSNPVYSALCLAVTMTFLGALYFLLDAYFVAAAQVVVYAGAVMVLFVMVIMLFDLKRESADFLKISPASVSKLVAIGALCGFLAGTAWMGRAYFFAPTPAIQKTQAPQVGKNPDEDLTSAEADKYVQPSQEEFGSTEMLSRKLFTKYVFAFEAVSLILLLAIVGAVALARSRGGTHHVPRQ